MPDQEIVILGGARTPFGTFLGTLKDMTATQLGTIAAKEALVRSGVEPGMIDHTVVGNVIQSAADGVYIGRHFALAAGVPKDKPGYCVNRMCASGFQAVVSGAKEILTGGRPGKRPERPLRQYSDGYHRREPGRKIRPSPRGGG